MQRFSICQADFIERISLVHRPLRLFENHLMKEWNENDQWKILVLVQTDKAKTLRWCCMDADSSVFIKAMCMLNAQLLRKVHVISHINTEWT